MWPFKKNAMQLGDSKTYISNLRQHYEKYFGICGNIKLPTIGPTEKLHPDFYLLEFPPNKKIDVFCYCTVGMSLDRKDDNLIELFVYSPSPGQSLVDLLTFCAAFHKTGVPLNLNHTVNLGQPWISGSSCEYGFISLPYLAGEAFEIFNFEDREFHCYWYIPITEKERDFKVSKGVDALEELFEQKLVNYLNPNRKSFI